MIKINLFPWREWQQQHQRERLMGIIIGALLITVLSVFLGVKMVQGQQRVQDQRNEPIRGQIRDYNNRLASKMPVLQAKRSELIRRIEVINTIQMQRNRVTELLNVFPKLIPDGVYLQQLSVTGANISLGGQADGNSQLATFLANAEEHPQIKNINMQHIVTNRQGRASQQVSFKGSFSWVLADTLAQAQAQGGTNE
uniref:PilN domain-containing protein n=1 Tax=Thaumasiovibrio occultus TaxID=1891184 RepID=UPI000B34F08B|nr:PilN domain-containing protein [Thaumasiovibrio occultus]